MTREQAIEEWNFLYESGFTKIDIEKLVIDKIYDDFEAKDKLEYKRGWRDRATQSDLEEMACNNCKHKDGEIGGLTHCSYFEQFMPTEIGKCDIWEDKSAR